MTYNEERKNPTKKSAGRYGRKIIELTTGREFGSLKEASAHFGVASSSITFCAQGVMPSVRGLTFAYADGKGRRGAQAPIKDTNRGRPLGSGAVRLPYLRLDRKTYDGLILAAREAMVSPDALIVKFIRDGLGALPVQDQQPESASEGETP